MSLDVYLYKSGAKPQQRGSGIFVRKNGRTVEISREEWDALHPGWEPFVVNTEPNVVCEDESNFIGEQMVFSSNITHNLNTMADAAGIYEVLWRPEEIGLSKASELIEPIKVGLEKLKSNPDLYKKFDSPNGWGVYEDFVPFVEEYLEACVANPDARVEVSR